MYASPPWSPPSAWADPPSSRDAPARAQRLGPWLVAPTDAELVRAAQADPARFDAIYRRYLPRVYRYVRARVGGSGDAEDIVSAAFMEVLTSLPRYREQGRFAAWLFTIARRRITAHRRRHFRREGREAQVEEEALRRLPDGARGGESLLERDRLERAMARHLSEDQREALRLRFYGDLPIVEIARVMGKGESAVKMLLHRGLHRLRDAMAADAPPPPAEEGAHG